jgi:hypothetical protein
MLALALVGQRWYLPTGIDWRIATFTMLVSVGAVIVFGLVPAFASTEMGLPLALKSGNRTHSASRFRQFATRGFVVTQIALSVLLVASAALLLRSFRNLAHQDFGYDVEQVLTASLAPSSSASASVQRSTHGFPWARSRHWLHPWQLPPPCGSRPWRDCEKESHCSARKPN